MRFQHVFSLLQKPYHLLFKDVISIYKLMSARLRFEIILLILLMFAQAATEILTVMSIRHLGMAPSSPDSLAAEFPYSTLFSLMPDLKIWAFEAPQKLLLLAATVATVFVLIKNTVTFCTMRKTTRTSEDISLGIGSEMMERYLYSDYRWHISKSSAQALQMMMWRGNLANLLIQQLSAVTGFITCAVLFMGMILQEPKLSLIVMTTSITIGMVIYAGLRRGVDATTATMAQANMEENTVIIAATRGIRDVLIYGQQPAFGQALANAIRKGINPKIFVTLANSFPSLLLEIVGFGMIPVTVLLLIRWDAGLNEILSAVMLLVLTAWRILPYLNRGVGQMVIIRGLRPMALPVLDFLQTLRRNRLDLPPPPDPDFRFTDAIELVDVDFSYPDSATQSLHAVSLRVPKGKLVGFIGPSGAGKSTTCNLVCGLCSPEKGQFLVDGKIPNEAELAAFKRLVGFVPQSPFLMAGTLADNVAFSQWGKPWDTEKVLRACKLAAIDFIPLNEEGILYPIGDNGSGLSGGQAQRVSIARALYAEPEILIFDEATSALDSGNENIIVSSIEHLRGTVTCVIIAHRLTTVEHCDILYWFDNGRIVASGTPEEILPRYTATFSTTASE